MAGGQSLFLRRPAQPADQRCYHHGHRRQPITAAADLTARTLGGEYDRAVGYGPVVCGDSACGRSVFADFYPPVRKIYQKNS